MLSISRSKIWRKKGENILIPCIIAGISQFGDVKGKQLVNNDDLLQYHYMGHPLNNVLCRFWIWYDTI